VRVGFLTQYPVSEISGWPTSLLRMMQALQARRLRVELLYEAPRQTRSLEWLRRMRILPDEQPPEEAQLTRAAAEADRRAASVDVILTALGSPLLARMRASQPVVHVTDATWPLLRDEYPEHSAGNARQEETELTVMRRADAHVFSSEWARASALRHFGVPLERTSVVPLGANFAATAAPAAAPAPVASARRELLFVGRSWQRKRGEIAVGVMEELRRRGRPARLTVIGARPPESMRRASAELRDLGWLEPERSSDAAAYRTALLEAHFLVLPSRADCTPIVCAEASSFGVPVLASAVGGMDAMVEPGVNGELLDRAAGPAVYADRIEAWWSNPSGYLALRRSTRARYEARWTWNAWAADLGTVLASVCAARTGSGRP
jgi:glycosyltransferase involved in cell wall biosynthesis